MKIKKFNNFILESLGDEEDIRNILYEVGGGDLKFSSSQNFMGDNKAPYGLYVYTFEDFIDDVSTDDIETVSDRLEDIGIKLVCCDFPNKKSSTQSRRKSLSFLLCPITLYNKYKSSGYKFLDDVEWREWEVASSLKMTNQNIQGNILSNMLDKIGDTKRGEYFIGDMRVSIIKGNITALSHVNESDRYEFMSPIEDDVDVYYGNVAAELFNIYTQQKIFATHIAFNDADISRIKSK